MSRKMQKIVKRRVSIQRRPVGEGAAAPSVAADRSVSQSPDTPRSRLQTPSATLAALQEWRDRYAQYLIPLEELHRQLDEQLGDRSLSEEFLKIRYESN